MNDGFNSSTVIRWLLDKQGNVLGYQNSLNHFKQIPTVVYSNINSFLGLNTATAGLIRLDGNYGDYMAGAAPSIQNAEAISTTLVSEIIIPVQTSRVRIAWQGAGSAGALSGTEKLFVVANEHNQVAGLIATQSVHRRHATMAVGEAIYLSSKAPITTLHFSSDSSILINRHSIDVTPELVSL